MIKDFILNLLETCGSRISCWAWNKRWSNRNYKERIKDYRK